MIKRRRLGDLYVRGKFIDVDDGTPDDPVRVWLQKLNEVDRDTVVRRANAAKARFLIEADDDDSELYASMYATVRDFDDREGLVALAIGEDLEKYRARYEAEVALDDESWGKDGYLQGLVDSWVGTDEEPGLAATHAQDAEDPEAKKVLAELERFEQQVSDATRAELDRLQGLWSDADEDTLWRAATEALLKTKASEIFFNEFNRQQIFHVVREPEDHAQRYFTRVTEVDDLEPGVRDQLLNSYNVMVVSPMEGKGLGASQPSSSSSEVRDPTLEPSGPSDVSE